MASGGGWRSAPGSWLSWLRGGGCQKRSGRVGSGRNGTGQDGLSGFRVAPLLRRTETGSCDAALHPQVYTAQSFSGMWSVVLLCMPVVCANIYFQEEFLGAFMFFVTFRGTMG